MAEIDRFDSELTAAVQAFADRARTEVDAVAVATHAARGRRVSASGWFGRTVPVPIVVILALLLVALLVATLAAGGWWPFKWSLGPAISTATTAVAAPSQTTAIPDANGGVHVTGTETVAIPNLDRLVDDGLGPNVLRGVVGVTSTTSDPRASGTGTFTFDIDGETGAEWGSFSLQGADGGWSGPCTGSVDMTPVGLTTATGTAAIGTCWLTGSGAYAGLTYFRGYSWVPGRVWVEGIIYPGPPPVS